MEVLNKNQRETAVWRLVAFGFIVLAINAVVMFASWKAFKDKGAGDANSLRKELEACKATNKGLQEKLNNANDKYNTDVKKLKDQMKNKDPEREALKSQLDIKQTTIEALQAQLALCKSGKTNN